MSFYTKLSDYGVYQPNIQIVPQRDVHPAPNVYSYSNPSLPPPVDKSWTPRKFHPYRKLRDY